MEAVAAAFAVDVPRVALLVLPASAPLQRAVYDLRMLGVNAHGLDLLANDRGRAHLLRGAGDRVEANPTLLVSTLASTRGLDLPDLSHVFILGVPEGEQSAEQAAAAVEFALEGLYLTRRLAKDTDGIRTVYGA